MDIYTKLYEATGGKIQQTKIMFYCWKWIYKNGKQNIIQLNATIVVHGETIKAIDVSQSTRTLGVHLNPAISWKGQFEVMRKKMNTSITKMMNMEINSYQAAMYFNVYMIKTVFFGCGIVELNDKQEKELRRIYEEPMLRKLGLSVKFPRTALYSRRSALGVGLILPSTLIAMLKIKLYIGNIRKLGHATDSIKMQEDYQEIEAGRNIRLGENPKMRYWKKTWIDEVSEELWKRQATFQTSVEQRKQRTKNGPQTPPLKPFRDTKCTSGDVGTPEENLQKKNGGGLSRQPARPMKVTTAHNKCRGGLPGRPKSNLRRGQN